LERGNDGGIIIEKRLAFHKCRLNYFYQGTLIEGEGAVQLTSSLRLLVLLQRQIIF
jgi:hypothetical protein